MTELSAALVNMNASWYQQPISQSSLQLDRRAKLEWTTGITPTYGMSFQHAHLKSDTTPPSSFAKEPLTPPPSEQKSGTSEQQIIQEIEGRRSGRGFSTDPWLRYRLSQSAYERLEERFLGDGFVQDKLRY